MNIKKIFETIDNIKNIKEINTSFSQKIMYVEGENKYIVKIYKNIKKGENEKRFLEYFKKNLNVPKVYKSGIEEKEYFIIMEYIEGITYQDEDELTIDNDVFKNIGRLLGQMHSLKPIEDDNWIEYMLKRINENYLVLKGKGIKFDKCYEYLIKETKLLKYEPCCIHSDFRMGNLILGNDVTLIDLESVKTGDSIFDFMKLYRVLNDTQFNCLIEGYTNIKKLDNNFLKKLHFYNLYDAFTTMGYCIIENRYNSDFYKFNYDNLYKEMCLLWGEE